MQNDTSSKFVGIIVLKRNCTVKGFNSRDATLSAASSLQPSAIRKFFQLDHKFHSLYHRFTSGQTTIHPPDPVSTVCKLSLANGDKSGKAVGCFWHFSLEMECDFVVDDTFTYGPPKAQQNPNVPVEELQRGTPGPSDWKHFQPSSDKRSPSSASYFSPIPGIRIPGM